MKKPRGLAGGKKVIIVSTRGGLYGAGATWATLDHQEPYLQGVLGFLGVTDVSFVRAEGLKMADNREASMEAAHSAIALVI